MRSVDVRHYGPHQSKCSRGDQFDAPGCACTWVELPLPAALAERLPQILVGIDEGVVVLYEDSAGSGAFVTLTTQRGDLEEHRAVTERVGATTSDIEVAGAAGFDAVFDTATDEADVRAVARAPTEGIVASLTLTGFDTAEVDLAALAESAAPLDDQTWAALQEITGWAAAIRSATGDYDTEPIDVDALELSDLMPPAPLVAALAGVDIEAIDVTADAAPEAAWRILAGGETLPLTAQGRTYTWSSPSLEVLLAITLDEVAASAADDLIGGLGDDGDGGPVPTSEGPATAHPLQIFAIVWGEASATAAMSRSDAPLACARRIAVAHCEARSCL